MPGPWRFWFVPLQLSQDWFVPASFSSFVQSLHHSCRRTEHGCVRGTIDRSGCDCAPAIGKVTVLLWRQTHKLVGHHTAVYSRRWRNVGAQVWRGAGAAVVREGCREWVMSELAFEGFSRLRATKPADCCAQSRARCLGDVVPPGSHPLPQQKQARPDSRLREVAYSTPLSSQASAGFSGSLPSRPWRPAWSQVPCTLMWGTLLKKKNIKFKM